MDHKMAAAGDETNLQKTDEHERPARVPEKFYEEVLEYLLSFTQATMNEKDRALWIQRLSKVPVWKLKRLDEFSSPFINNVWDFLNSLQMPPQAYRAPQLPDHSTRAQLEKQVSMELFAGIRKIMADENIKRGGHTAAISRTHRTLKIKYPMFAGNLSL